MSRGKTTKALKEDSISGLLPKFEALDNSLVKDVLGVEEKRDGTSNHEKAHSLEVSPPSPRNSIHSPRKSLSPGPASAQHAVADEPGSYKCDYDQCHGRVFNTKLKCLGHLVIDHNEDTCSAVDQQSIFGSLAGEQADLFWGSRKLNPQLWRCQECLTINKTNFTFTGSGIEGDMDWNCEKCSVRCHPERKKRRVELFLAPRLPKQQINKQNNSTPSEGSNLITHKGDRNHTEAGRITVDLTLTDDEPSILPPPSTVQNKHKDFRNNSDNRPSNRPHTNDASLYQPGEASSANTLPKQPMDLRGVLSTPKKPCHRCKGRKQKVSYFSSSCFTILRRTSSASTKASTRHAKGAQKRALNAHMKQGWVTCSWRRGSTQQFCQRLIQLPNTLAVSMTNNSRVDMRLRESSDVH